jgi:rhomboid protease GluP
MPLSLPPRIFMTQSPRRSILCPSCRKLIHVDEPYCPFCSTPRPGSWWRNNPVTRGMDDADRLIRVIIYANIGMFVLSILMNPWSTNLSFNPFTFFSPDPDSLLLLGATGTLPIDGLHRWWTLLTANYLHGGILHIAFNMMALKQLAPVVIREYGSHRMIVLYTLGGVVGFWASYLAGVRFTIGASAAVCSLMGALLYYGKSRGGQYGQAIYKQVAGWVVSLSLFGFMIPGINNWGHGGGIVGGALLGYLLGYREQRPARGLQKTIAIGCGGLTVVALAWGVVSGVLYRLVG